MTKKFSDGTKLTIELDANEIFPNDPGQGTPAMVILHDEAGREADSGTFECASCEGELSHNGTTLTEDQAFWIQSKSLTVEKFIARHTLPVS